MVCVAPGSRLKPHDWAGSPPARVDGCAFQKIVGDVFAREEPNGDAILRIEGCVYPPAGGIEVRAVRLQVCLDATPRADDCLLARGAARLGNENEKKQLDLHLLILRLAAKIAIRPDVPNSAEVFKVTCPACMERYHV